MRHLILVIFLFCIPSFAFAQLETAAKQAILIDHDTGQVLFEKNADESMPTSSMSKVMTIYLVFEALKTGQITLDTEFVVSEKAWRKGGSKMFVRVGDHVRVEDLIRGVVVQSGNDATIVLAEGLAGSEDLFADALNAKAKELRMNNTNLMNASGWPDPDHYSTARDLAKLAQAMIRNFPEYYHYYSEPRFRYAEITQENRNPLLSRNIGADGLKTGHTDDGGYGLIGTGVNKDGRRVIMVLNGMESKTERKTESVRMLKWALDSFASVSLFKDGKILEQAPVYLGKRAKVGLQSQQSLQTLVPKLQIKNIRVDVQYDKPLKAPIERGQVVGKILVHVPNKEQAIEVPLVAAEAVEQMSLIFRLLTKARLLVTGAGRFE